MRIRYLGGRRLDIALVHCFSCFAYGRGEPAKALGERCDWVLLEIVDTRESAFVGG